MNRKEKIQVLSSIAAGKKSIEDLLPESRLAKVIIWQWNRELNTYINYETGEVLSEEEFNKKDKNLKDRNNRINCIIIPPLDED